MPRPLIHLIPHTHWDREWYLPLGAFRTRFVVALDALLDQLEADPRLTSFLLDGQTVLLEDYLAIRPEQQTRLAALVAAGRLQTGPWYVLADEQIPAGESLLRNLAEGRAASAAFGRRLEVLYSPDAFGHPPMLPALGAEFGIETGVLWRGLGPDRTAGRDLAWWQAPDGRRILIYHLPPDGYEIGSNLLCTDAELPAAWARVSAHVLPRAATRHVAIFVGADHHAAAPELGGLATRLQAIAPEFDFRCSRLDDYLGAARGEAGELAMVDGELRWSYGYTWTLQGVHGTRAPLKRRNSELELRAIRQAEPLVALAPGPRRAGQAAVVRNAWREILQCHFHDAIGGCASDAVARAMATRFDDAEAALREVTRGAMHAAAGHDPDLARERGPFSPRLALWSPVARPRGGVAIADLTFFRRDILVGRPGARLPRRGVGVQPFLLRFHGAQGAATELAPQLLSTDVALERLDAARHYPDQDEVDIVRVAFPLPRSLPGLGVTLLDLAPGDLAPQEPFTAARGRRLWNGRIEAAVESLGTIVLRAPGEGKPFAGLLGLESERDAGDSYSFAPVRRDTVRRPGRAVRPVVTAAGPFVSALDWTVALRGGRGVTRGEGRVEAGIRLEAIGDSPVLRCTIRLDNQALDHRLRLRFPTGLRRASVLAGAQFGVVARHGDKARRGRFPAEQPVATAPAHRWVAAARGGQGLALFLPGFFEYEWTSGGDLLLTLLRSIGELSRDDLRTRPGHAGWPTAIPEAQCVGAEAITLGITPVSAEALAAPDRLEQLWEDVMLPPQACWMRDYSPADAPASAGAGLQLEGAGLVFSACLPARDSHGVILRCYSVADHPVAGRWRLPRPVRRARLVRADETAIADLRIGEAERAVEFSAGPRGIVSVLVEWNA